MIQGSQNLKTSSCAAMTALSGFDPTSHIVLVRNPNYSPATDSKQMRANYLNGVTINIDTNISDIYNRIQSGQLDGAMFNAPPAVVVHQYQTNPAAQGLPAHDAYPVARGHHDEPRPAAVRRHPRSGRRSPTSSTTRR